MSKIVCIGAGRLAHNLMPQLEEAGCHVIQVYNRTESAADSLSKKLTSASFTSRITEIKADADLYFIAVADDSIKTIAGQLHYLENGKRVFVHCSGVLGLQLLPFRKRGVFYPLQTFSENHPVPWHTTPILITSDTEDVKGTLLALARTITHEVTLVTDQQKSVLHLAAVFANNFTNHMLMLAEKICEAHMVSFDILKPLINETVNKALDVGPANSQTGPAVRGDQKTIEKHLAMLAEDPKLVELYRNITSSIQSYTKK